MLSGGCLRPPAVPETLDDHRAVELGEHPLHLPHRGTQRVIGVVLEDLALVRCERAPAVTPDHREDRLLHGQRAGPTVEPAEDQAVSVDEGLQGAGEPLAVDGVTPTHHDQRPHAFAAAALPTLARPAAGSGSSTTCCLLTTLHLAFQQHEVVHQLLHAGAGLSRELLGRQVVHRRGGAAELVGAP